MPKKKTPTRRVKPLPKWPKFIWATVTADRVSDGYWESVAEAKARLKKECPGGRIIRHGTTGRDYAKMDQEYAIHAFRSFIEDLCGYDIRHQPKR